MKVCIWYNRNVQKKNEDNDLKSAAFRAPVQQKKKNQRPIKGQKRGKNTVSWLLLVQWKNPFDL